MSTATKPLAGVADLIAAVPRAIQMLHVAGARAISYAADEVTHYDDTDCDGYCIHSDCMDAVVQLQAALGRIAGAQS